MTAVDFIYSKESIIVATDTMTLDENKEPLRYCTKAFYMPHIKCIICGVGSLQHILGWVKLIEEMCLVDNIEMLNRIAEKQLPILKKEIKDKFQQEISSTIYHFGYNEFTKQMEAYALRSVNNFVAEQLSEGIAVRPQEGIIDKIDNGEINVESHIELFIQIMKHQKEFDDNLPKSEMVGIGGEINMYVLSSEGCYTSTIYRFEDYDKHYSQMLKRVKL